MICSLRKNIFISCLKYSCRNQVRSHSSAESRARWQISRRRHPGSVRAAARTPCSSSQTWACPSREARNTAAGRSFCCWGRCRSTSRDRLCMATLAFVPLWNAPERYWWMNVEPIIYKYPTCTAEPRAVCCKRGGRLGRPRPSCLCRAGRRTAGVNAASGATPRPWRRRISNAFSASSPPAARCIWRLRRWIRLCPQGAFLT